MNKRVKQGLFLFFLLFFPSVFYVLLSTGKTNFTHLPYFGPKEVAANGDTIYHSIPSFRFLNQDGKYITDKDLYGKMYVANFFFTTCKSICPAMSAQLIRVQERFKDMDDVQILSHTVDPENDSVEVLKEYSKNHIAINTKWNFVTGNKKELYDIAQNGYLVNALEAGENAEEAFIHSELFILIDKEKHIRAIYDGTSTADVNKLIEDINTLKAAYEIKKHKEEHSQDKE